MIANLQSRNTILHYRINNNDIKIWIDFCYSLFYKQKYSRKLKQFTYFTVYDTYPSSSRFLNNYIINNYPYDDLRSLEHMELQLSKKFKQIKLTHFIMILEYVYNNYKNLNIDYYDLHMLLCSVQKIKPYQSKDKFKMYRNVNVDYTNIAEFN